MSTTDHGGRRPGAGRPKAAQAAGASQRARLLQARTRKEEALAELRRIQVAIRRGELREADAVAREWADKVAVARAHLLALPSKLAQRVAAPGKQAEVQALAQEIVYSALNELADDWERERRPKRKASVEQ